MRAVIPVRLNGSKSRLAPILQLEERTGLSIRMFRDVLKVVQSAPSVSGTFVVSPDACLPAVLRGLNEIKVVAENGAEGINAAIRKVVKLCDAAINEGILIIPIDIPLLRVEDIESIVAMAEDQRAIVIAPSKDGRGTNGLLLKPPNVFATEYGIDSFMHHLGDGIKAGICPKIYNSPTIELDIDTPKDLAEFFSLGKKNLETYSFIMERGIDKRLVELSVPLRI